MSSAAASSCTTDRLLLRFAGEEEDDFMTTPALFKDDHALCPDPVRLFCVFFQTGSMPPIFNPLPTGTTLWAGLLRSIPQSVLACLDFAILSSRSPTAPALVSLIF